VTEPCASTCPLSSLSPQTSSARGSTVAGFAPFGPMNYDAGDATRTCDSHSGNGGPLRLRKTAERCLPETLVKWFAVFVAAAVFSLAG
jgi:hypothetical protein